MKMQLNSRPLQFAIALALFWLAKSFLAEGVTYDGYQLWVIGRAVATGANPYDVQKLQQIWAQSIQVDYFANPALYSPLAMWLFLLLQRLPIEWFPFLWGLALSAILAWGTWCCLATYKVELQGRLTAILSFLNLLIFLPCPRLIVYGQTTAVTLVGALYACSVVRRSDSPGRKSQFIAGITLAVTLLKPHLFVPLYIFVAAQTIRKRLAYFGLGVIAGIAAMLVPVLVSEPDILQSYAAAVGLQSAFIGEYYSPTLGAQLRALGLLSWPQALVVLPSFAAVSALLILRSKLEAKAGLLAEAILLLCGLVFAPYAWTYDFVLALPAVTYLACELPSLRGAKSWSASLCILSSLSLLQLAFEFGPVNMGSYFWYPLTLLVLTLLGARLRHRTQHQ